MMINKIYKYGFYTLAIPAVLFLAYCTVYGVFDRAHAFAQWMTGINDAGVIAYCNEGDNMMTKAICTGATVGVE